MRDEDDIKPEDSGDDDGFRLYSDIHKDLSSLIQAKTRVLTDNRDRIKRRDVVHAFTNLRNTLTEDEKRELGREEITNFGSTFRAAQVNIAPLESIVIGTDALVEVIIDTNNPTRDHLVGVEISNKANDWLFTSNERFHQFWRTSAGEGYLCGGGPAVFDFSDEGLFPRYNRNMLFPKGSALDSEGITFCFEKRDMSLGDLEELHAVIEAGDSSVQKEAIEKLIGELKDQLAGKGTVPTVVTAGVSLDNNSARDDATSREATLEVWAYWEVRMWKRDHRDREKRGHKYVSNVLFIDGYAVTGLDKKDAQAVIYQEEVAFDDPCQWLVMVIFDEEIGGEKTVDTLRGLAEAYYKPAVLIEELRNVEIEGAMQAARLTLQETEGADPDEVLDFELGRDLFAPKGVQVLQLPNTGNQVRPVVADLMQTVSGIAASDHANTRRGQELRQQALERQDNTMQIRTNRVVKGYLKIDKILDLVMGRALTLDPDPGTADYRLIRGFQEAVDEALVTIFRLADDDGVDDGIEEVSGTALAKAKKLRLAIAERRYGRFRRIRVKARRSASGLDRPTEIENASFILRMIETGRVPAENVPALLERAIAYQTQNTDIAAMIANVPEPIKADQLERAALEWEVIGRRALVGEVYPIGPRDIDEDHVEAHTLDLIADVNQQGIRPWDQLDVVKFTARINHTGAHIERMRSRPESAGIARQKMMELQEVVKQAGAIIQELEAQRVAQENQNLSPDDRLKLAREQLTYAQIEMLGRKFGVDVETARDVARNRITRAQQGQQRMNLMERQQLVQEVQADRDFRIRSAQLHESDREPATAK